MSCSPVGPLIPNAPLQYAKETRQCFAQGGVRGESKGDLQMLSVLFDALARELVGQESDGAVM